ncbi:LamG-like jellyroll fold domain-containing protein [Flavobacterium faecale]|nr:LamG-like jellyroll fold domain-containing protein [Flavobacterium faecale]
MKKITLKLIAPLFILFTSMLYSQAIMKVSYGMPSITVANGSTVAYGLSEEIDFTITNEALYGNQVLYIYSLNVSNSNFVVSSSPLISDAYIRRYERGGVFSVRKNTNSCTSNSAVVTIGTNLGTFSFTVTFAGNSLISVYGGSPTTAVPNGLSVPTATTGTAFGTVGIGSSEYRYFFIVNSGNCPLTINPITILPSSDYSIVLLNVSTLQARTFTYFAVKFSPSSTGLKTATITIPNSDPLTPNYTFSIAGEGYDATVVGPGGGNADFRLWLKANRGISLDSGSKVPLWRDLGSLGKDASQTNVALQPTFVDDLSQNINYNPVVKFENNGSTISQYLENVDNGYYTQETFVVVQPDVAIGGAMTIISGTTAPAPLFSLVSDEMSGIGFGDFTSRLTGEKVWMNQWGKSASVSYFTLASSSGNYSKAGMINSRNKSTSVTDGTELLYNTTSIGSLVSSNRTYQNLGYLDTSITPNIVKGTPYNIGKNSNSGTALGDLNGRVAEVLSYASRIPDGDRPKIESYLALKYGITMGVNGTSKNYLNSAGGVIWDVAVNAGFNYNIAGIGKDTASDLDQKQSKSSNDVNVVTIGLGVVETTNSLNINDFSSDRNFLIWGSDNGTFTAGTTNNVYLRSGLNSSITRINKNWKIVEQGGDVSNVFVSVPATAFSTMTKTATEEYVLIVSDNANFSNTDIIDVIPLKADAIGNLQTWYDFDGTKFFTFGKAAKTSSKSLVNMTSGSFLVGEYALNLNSGSFSIACWIRNNSSGQRTIISKGLSLELKLNAANKIEGYWDGVLKFVSNTSIPDFKWHHVTAVYHLGSAHLYIDGMLDVSVFNLTNPTPNYARFSIGAKYISKSDIRTPFLGEIDEVSIWDIGLTVAQVNYLMNQEVQKGATNMAMGKILPEGIVKNELAAVPWNSLKAYYDFNSFYGSTVEGLTDERNFLRINYLSKNKDITTTQTAPLPYETIADGTWEDETIWKNGAVQITPNDMSIVDPTRAVDGNIVTIKHNIISSGNKTVLGLVVEGTDATTFKTLTAANNSKIAVSHYLKLDGLIDLKGRSQLVQTMNSELDNASIGFIKRDQQGTINKYNFNYWSSPVGPIAGANNADFIVKDLFKDGTTATEQDIVWTDSYDGSNTPLTLSRYWLFKFKNSGATGAWSRFREDTGTIASQGFILKGSSDPDPTNMITQNYTFKGKPYNGPIAGAAIVPGSLFLVGNPYASALDGYEFIRDNISVAKGGNNATDIIDGTLYFWEHSPANATHVLAGYTGGYATLTLTGATPPVAPLGIYSEGNSAKIPYQYIPVGQGFFVVGAATISGSATVKFDNNQRAFVKEDAVDELSAPLSNTMFRMTAQKTSHFKDNGNDALFSDNEIKVRLGFNATTSEHRQLLLGFMNESATDGYDNGYDGFQIDTKANDIYFLIQNSKFSVQGVGTFEQDKAYALGVNVGTAGEISFMVDGQEFLPSTQNVYIHDKENNVYYDITSQPAKITLAVGVYTKRFELSFKSNAVVTLGTETTNPKDLVSNVIVSTNNTNKTVTVAKNNDVEIISVTIYNVLGQRLVNTKKTNNVADTIQIPFSVPAGVYVVKVQTNKGVYTTKIITQ